MGHPALLPHTPNKTCSRGHVASPPSSPVTHEYAVVAKTRFSMCTDEVDAALAKLSGVKKVGDGEGCSGDVCGWRCVWVGGALAKLSGVKKVLPAVRLALPGYHHCAAKLVLSGLPGWLLC